MSAYRFSNIIVKRTSRNKKITSFKQNSKKLCAQKILFSILKIKIPVIKKLEFTTLATPIPSENE